ncbi:hypothetical protein GCM10017562_24000 [Streptomyces roseofulvus]|uniref:hypothetical protein n=1 Tax=Streptomyces roseofulvus TaxID=33902 RepID=UPI0031F954CC
MQGKGRAASAALAVVLALGAAGCGAGDGAAYGREAAQAEIRTVVAGAGLPESKLPEPGEATGTAVPATERERVARRAEACAAAWQYAGPVLDGGREKYEKALDAFVAAGWTESGKRWEDELGEGAGTAGGALLKKAGWSLSARHHASRQGLSMDVMAFTATEDACMEQFTEQELDLLSGDRPGGEPGH